MIHHLEVAERLSGGRGRADELLRLLVVVVPSLVHLGARLRLHAVDAHRIFRSLEAAEMGAFLSILSHIGTFPFEATPGIG